MMPTADSLTNYQVGDEISVWSFSSLSDDGLNLENDITLGNALNLACSTAAILAVTVLL